MDYIDSETQEPDDLPYLETEYGMPPPLAAECKSFKWKTEVIDTAGKIEGKMISKEVWKIQNSKVIVHFDEVSGQPIGESGSLLGSWLGQLSNDVNLLPINYSDWRMVNPHIKNKAWEVLQSKFWFDDPPMRKVFVMSALGSRCKDVKLRLWKEYKRDSHFVHMRFTEKWKEELTTLLGQKSHVTNNAIASLDDEYAQVFGPERPGRIENSEMVIDLKSQVKELSDQVKGMTTFIQQVIGTSTGEHLLPIYQFHQIQIRNGVMMLLETKTQTLEAMAVIFINISLIIFSATFNLFYFMNLHDGLVDLISNTLFII
ncbi:unnamed protein product [Brassica napus]|uniref:(rape) hypothetical protein n=1 Tax=Brassica napus TaxID=3708 RepID=A0A816RPP6_BRANA|nr:unnamed protein product [Brassica napus]